MFWHFSTGWESPQHQMEAEPWDAAGFCGWVVLHFEAQFPLQMDLVGKMVSCILQAPGGYWSSNVFFVLSSPWQTNQENSNCQWHEGINYETHKTVNTGNIYGMLLCYEEKANEEWQNCKQQG